ncbi:MAG TPA: toprim domain-containing protein, partial [Acidimicrobiales bacterium]|nr:toprim domain-containing protein [Acidimicrobiales bacterium]
LAVATCGTALTDDHVALLNRFAARRLVLAFDADGAGQAAAERFYRWEREHDLEVAVADLPVGHDPADVARTDPERLAKAVDGAVPFLRFRLERAFAAADLATNEGRARGAERALEVIAEHPADLVRDQYVMDVASRCRIEPDRLRAQLATVRSRRRGGGRGGRAGRLGAPAARRVDGIGPGRRPGGDETAAPHPASSGERSVPNHPGGDDGTDGRNANGSRRAGREGPAHEVLRHAVHNPGEVGRWLDAALFDDPIHAGAYEALLDAETHAEALASSPPAVADLLARLMVEEPTSQPFDAVRRLLTEVARREIGTLRLVSASVDDPARALADLAVLNRVIDGLRDQAAAVESAERLLAWFEERVGDGG